MKAYGLRMENDGIGTPNCPECLTMLWPAGSDEHPYFWCPTCKVARLSQPDCCAGPAASSP
jgi:hypothetical protein